MSKTHLKIVDKFFSWIACYQGNLTKKLNVKDILSDTRQIFLVGCWLYNQTKSGETLKDMFRLYRARLLNFVNSYCRQVFYQTGNNMGDLHFRLGLVEPEAFVHLSGFWNRDWIFLRHLSKISRNKAKLPAPAALTQFNIKN